MKKITLLVLLILQTMTYSQIPSTISTEGLIGFWNFSGNANDSSVNLNNGSEIDITYENDRFGNASGAARFNGFSSYIELPATSTMSQLAGNNDYTISTWLNITNWHSSGNVFALLEWYDVDSAGSAILLEANWAANGVLFFNNLNQPIIGCYYTWNFNEWKYLSVTYNQNMNEVKVYIDGILLETHIRTATPINQTSPLTFGRSLSGPDEYSNGLIDDFIIYSRTLSDTEIQNLYNQSNPALFVKDVSLLDNDVKIFPNPTNSILNIKSIETIKSIQIIDIAGRITTVSNFENDHVDVSGLADGMYFIEIKTENGLFKEKFIKK